MILQESGENYLETILMLQQQNGSVRSIDIATHMNFTKASVSIAMKKLRKQLKKMPAGSNMLSAPKPLPG